MTIEWLRRNDPVLDGHLRTYLFTSEPITAIEVEAEGSGGGPGDGSLGIGSLPRLSRRPFRTRAVVYAERLLVVCSARSLQARITEPVPPPTRRRTAPRPWVWSRMC